MVMLWLQLSRFQYHGLSGCAITSGMLDVLCNRRTLVGRNIVLAARAEAGGFKNRDAKFESGGKGEISVPTEGLHAALRKVVTKLHVKPRRQDTT